MLTRETVEQEIEKRLEQHKAAIKRLRVKANASGADARLAILAKLEELSEMEVRAEAQLNELRQASADNWQEQKSNIEKYWDSLGRELQAYDPEHK